MDLGRPLTTFERRLGHAWFAALILALLLLVFALATALIPGVRFIATPLCLLGAGAILWKTFFRGGVRLTVHEHGFRYEGGGKRIEAPWTRVADVRYSRVHVRSYGVLVSDNMGLGATLDSGERIDLLTREADGHRAIELFVGLSQPVVARRLAEAEASGGPIDFGEDLSLDAAGIHYQSFGQRLLRWEDVAGYRIYQGYLMVDRDPLAPRLAFKLPAYRIGNLPILARQLEQRLPQGDYDRFPQDPAKRSLSRTTAATHDPRYLTRRQRLAVLFSPLALVPLVLFYALLSLPWAMSLTTKRSAYLAALGEETRVVERELAAMPGANPAASLRDACAAVQFGPVGGEVEVKIGALPAGVISSENKYSYDKYPRLGFLKGTSEDSWITTIDGDIRPAKLEASLFDSVVDLLGTPPWGWPTRLERMDKAQRSQPFLVVAHVRELALMKKARDGGVEPGRATLHVRILSHGGDLLCEGLVKKAYPPDVRGFVDEGKVLNYALAAATMVDVCDKLGGGYCASLRRFVTEPEAAAPAPPPSASSSAKAPVKKPRR